MDAWLLGLLHCIARQGGGQALSRVHDPGTLNLHVVLVEQGYLEWTGARNKLAVTEAGWKVIETHPCPSTRV